MCNIYIKFTLLLTISLSHQQIVEETTEYFSESNLLCDENSSCSSIITESYENITELDNTTEIFTNKTNITDSGKESNSNVRKINYDEHTNNLEFCSCDLQLDYCDINCCCDTNCTDDQKLLFSECEYSPIYQDPHYCYTFKTSYINKTKVYWEESENRLFCIVRSNLPSYYTVQLNKPIPSMKTIENLVFAKNKWPKSLQQEDIKKTEIEKYKFGNNIWLYLQNSEIIPLMLPDKFSSNVCVQKKSIYFLKEFTSTCSQTSIHEDNVDVNPETYYKNIRFLSLPKIFNISSTDNISNYECLRYNCLPINVFLCNGSFNDCEYVQNETNIKLSCYVSAFRNENFCTFVTQKVKYEIYHNVSHGLTNINLYFVLTNITYFLNDDFEFIQHFEVKFFWQGYSQNFSSILSGNPGYITGKFILYGEINNSIDNSSMPQIMFKNNNDFTKKFFVIPKNYRTVCIFTKNYYLPILFGINLNTNCQFKYEVDLFENATDLCINLQKQIFILWQIETNNTFSESEKFIGMFGNANRQKLSEWVKIFYKFNHIKIIKHITGEFRNKKLICKNIVKNLLINIMYVYIDFKYIKNQAKILNVYYDTDLNDFNEIEYGYSEDKKKHSVSINLNFKVMFFDVTKPKIRQYVKPPNLQISLTHDFFYPFMMSKSYKFSFNTRLILFYTFFQLII